MQSFTFVVAAMSNGDGPHHTARKGGAAAIGMQQRSDEAKKRLPCLLLKWEQPI
jgi:hypothetical protein